MCCGREQRNAAIPDLVYFVVPVELISRAAATVDGVGAVDVVGMGEGRTMP